MQRLRSAARLSLAVALLASLAACKDDGPKVKRNEEDELFHNVCARCHGADGTGGPPDQLGNPGPKNFTDPTFQASITDSQIKSAIENGNRGMPAFGAVFTPQQVKLMIGRVRKFGPRAEGAPAVPPSAR